jgi:type IV secretion system protein VirB9
MTASVIALATPVVWWMPQAAIAGADAIPMPSETRLVQFRYDPNRTYEILTRPDASTDIVLDPGEKLKALAIGDTIQWVTADTDGHIFIKPVRPGLFTAGTIVTDKRSYQISLRSSPPDGNWYQRVSWAYQDTLLVKEVKEVKEKPKDASFTPPAVEDAPVSSTMVDLSKVNFGYTIKGDKGVVEQVFDDGKLTWIRMHKNIEQLPALFAADQDGNLSVANYRVEGNYIVVHQTIRRAILKLAEQEVEINRHED